MDNLRNALQNNKIEEINKIRNDCRKIIEDKSNGKWFDKKPNFDIKRDPFCEGNNLTDAIRKRVLVNESEENNCMVAVGR